MCQAVIEACLSNATAGFLTSPPLQVRREIQVLSIQHEGGVICLSKSLAKEVAAVEHYGKQHCARVVHTISWTHSQRDGDTW